MQGALARHCNSPAHADEPSMGLAPLMAETIRNISTQGVTILLVEQNTRLAWRLNSAVTYW